MTETNWKLRKDWLDSSFVEQQRSFSGKDVIFVLIVRACSFSMRTVIDPTENIKDKLDELWENMISALASRYVENKRAEAIPTQA